MTTLRIKLQANQNDYFYVQGVANFTTPLRLHGCFAASPLVSAHASEAALRNGVQGQIMVRLPHALHLLC
jgi:hypothetical protein